MNDGRQWVGPDKTPMIKKQNIVIGALDPINSASVQAQLARGERNRAWLSEHWADLLPHARGKFVAVAGQEGHVAESAESAWQWAQTAHPEDDGAIVQFVRSEAGPRVYANQGELAPMR